MKKTDSISLLFASFLLMMFVLACRPTGGNETNSGGFFDSFSDETAQATELVAKANEELREIRKIQKQNNGKLDELSEAMKERNTERTREILDEIIRAIQDGLSLGETALARIEQATEKKTNDKFNEYLRLKREALRKQLDAFDFRLKTAKSLRDQFGTQDQNAIEKAKAEFQVQEENFKKLWEAADELNDRANRIARENPGKIRAK